jgi:predicted amidohydrolase
MVVDPWGTVLARAGYREGVVVGDLDMTQQAQVRHSLPALEHRRPDVFTF